MSHLTVGTTLTSDIGLVWSLHSKVLFTIIYEDGCQCYKDI